MPDVLLRFAVAAARGEMPRARRAARAARAARVPRRALEEAALMLVLYAGYPAALEALRALSEAWPGRPRRSREAGRAGWRRAGERLCRRVYGPVYPRLLASVRRLHPDLEVWMVETGYGRVLSRGGLDARGRELVTVAVLAGTRWSRQLVSHLRGARRLGVPEAALRRAVRLGAGAGSARRPAARAWRDAFGGALNARWDLPSLDDS